MQFVPSSYFLQQHSQQQQQQQQQQQTSQSPASTSAQAEQQQQQPTQPQGLTLPPSLPAATFATQVAGLQPAPGVELNAQGKAKRKQVKNACVNCQKACKKCDDGRPCQRCIKYGLTDTCVNSVRKERKKGIKRGPYKKRKQDSSSGSTTSETPAASSSSPAVSLPPSSIYSGAYDPFNAGVSYPASAPMMHAYLPAAIQQMYPGAQPILTYQAAMNMLSPQHGQSNAGLYYRQDGQEQQDRSHEGSPATPQGDNEANVKPENIDSDDEGSKLNILSQLCSAVLDRNDGPNKNEPEQNGTSEKQTNESETKTEPRQASEENTKEVKTEGVSEQ